MKKSKGMKLSAILVALLLVSILFAATVSDKSTENKSIENIKINVDNPPYLDPTKKPMLSVEILNGNDVGDIVVNEISISDNQRQIVKVNPVKTLQPIGRELKELESIQNKKRNLITKAEFERGNELRSKIEISTLRQPFYKIGVETNGLKLGDTLELLVDVTVRIGTENVTIKKKANYTLFKFQTPKTNPYDSSPQEGKLNFTVTPEKTHIKEGENFKINLALKNTGDNRINVWKLEEQVSYNIIISYQNGTELPYLCGVIGRLPLTNEYLTEINPGESITHIQDTSCWELNRGEYSLRAVYYTQPGERITKPYWVGSVESEAVKISVG